MAELPKYFYFRVKSDVKSDGLTIQLEDASDADVVEVVRCKNCKHRRAVKWADGTVHWECVLDSGDPYEQSRYAEDDDWFCGDGEAKDG